VILSLVRSKPEYEIERNPSIGWCKRNMGFIIDEHQMNVALTRARLGLIIIGKYAIYVEYNNINERKERDILFKCSCRKFADMTIQLMLIFIELLYLFCLLYQAHQSMMNYPCDIKWSHVLFLFFS